MRVLAALLLAAALLTACGEEETPAPPAAGTQPEPTRTTAPQQTPKPKPEAEPRGTEIVLAGSEFGDMLYDDRRQAIYVFELDAENETNCSGECAVAWPPVYADGKPVAGAGVDEKLLGTIERDSGRQQVTYAGRPLYYYAHEGPGEVRCHNVDLNGGLWWVVGADGEPLP